MARVLIVVAELAASWVHVASLIYPKDRSAA
jgi:hypothetical protein